MKSRVMALATGLVLGSATMTYAQAADTALPRGKAGRLVRPREGKDAALAPNARQQALAKQIRQAFAGVVRRQLALTDDQSRRLQEVDQRYQVQRNEIGRDEREARLSLRTILEDSTATPDPAKVDDYLNRLVKAQRRRADLLESEQKDLSAFLNPVQRAKFLALRDQLQRRVAQLRQQGERGGAGDGRRAGPPPSER